MRRFLAFVGGVTVVATLAVPCVAGGAAASIPAPAASAVCTKVHGKRVCKKTALFGAPSGIAVDQQGHVYVADAMRDHIVELSPTGRILKTFGRRGTQPGQFMAPWGVAVDAHGDVYVSEAPGYSLSPASSPQPRRIQEVSPTGQPLAQIADATTGREAPCGIAIDAQGNLDVANFAGGQIMSFSPSLRRLGVIRTGDAWPCGIGLDAQGNIYVSLGTTEDIAKYAPNGTLLRTLGPRHAVDPPFGLALDTQGNVYAIDMGQDQIIKLSPAGAVLFHRGKFGAKRGQFSFNESQFLGVAVDHDGNVYVSDPGNHRVQKFSSSGQPLAVWK